MIKPRSWILSCALVLTATAGCGGSGSSQPPLPLSDGNATSVAAEALISSAQSSFSVQLPTGIITGTTAVLRKLAPAAAQRLTAAAAGPENADGTMTGACGVSGSQTITTAGTTVTFAFHDCVQVAGTKLDGSIKFTAQGATAGSTQISLSASFDFTTTTGTLSFAESGGYDIVIRTGQNPTDNTEFELTGDRFSVALSVGGKLRDQVTLSDFDIVISQQLTSTGQDVEHFMYEVDSSWLKGHIGVMTTQDLKQRTDLLTASQYPFAGQIVISGASHSRLRITILGDETFTPPAGQGQIELEVDPGTGAFGAPTWTSWAALSTMVKS